MNEFEMKGIKEVFEDGNIIFENVLFGYQEKEVLYGIFVILL